MAARKASEVRAARLARVAAYERDVEATVGVFFDRSGRAEQVRVGAQEKADRILAEASAEVLTLLGEADQAVAKLRKLGEPVVEIATMIGLPVSGVRASLTRAGNPDT
jgi:DNA-directed RNA polymerase specialized sigma24 family protein